MSGSAKGVSRVALVRVVMGVGGGVFLGVGWGRTWGVKEVWEPGFGLGWREKGDARDFDLRASASEAWRRGLMGSARGYWVGTQGSEAGVAKGGGLRARV